MPNTFNPIAALAALSQKSTLLSSDKAALHDARAALEDIIDDMALAEVTLEDLAKSIREGTTDFAGHADSLETAAESLNKLRHWVKDLMYFRDESFPKGEEK